MEKAFIIRFIKDTALTSFGTTASVGFQFLSIILLSRYLPKESLGLYFLVLATAHIFIVFTGLGLDLTQVRILSMTDVNEKVSSFGQIVFSRILFAIIIGILLVRWGRPLLATINQELAQLSVLLTWLFILANLRNLLFNTLQGFKLFTKFAWIQSGSALLRLLLIIGMIVLQNITITNMLYIEIVVPIIAILALLSCIPFRRFRINLKDKRQWVSLFRFSSPIYANNILTVIIDRANVLLMSILLNLQGVAIYEIASKIPDGLLKILQSFIVVYFPNLSQLFSAGKTTDAELLLNKSLGLISTFISLLIFCIFLFREEIIVFIFSNLYINAALPFALIMFTIHMRIVSNILGYSIISSGHPTVPVIANLISSTILIIGSIILIPSFGVIGAILSSTMMNMSTQIVYWVFLKRIKLKVMFLSYAKPLIIIFFICGIYLYINTESLKIKSIICVLYISIWILSNNIMKNILKKRISIAKKYIKSLCDTRIL